jgi:hypothetical protein
MRTNVGHLATTLRVSGATRVRAVPLASQRGTSIGEVVDSALDALGRPSCWRKTRDALARRPVERRLLRRLGRVDPLVMLSLSRTLRLFLDA